MSNKTGESGEDTGQFSGEDGELYWKYAFPVVGVGGIGTRIVDQLWTLGLTTSLRIAIDTDRANLEQVRADRRILIGRSLSEKYEVNTLIGMLAAERSRPTIGKFLEDANMTFVLAGIGGGTGAGAAPVMGEIARACGLTIGVAIVPFVPGPSIPLVYQKRLEVFMESVDSLIIIESNQIKKYAPDLPEDQIIAAETALVAQTICRWIRMMTGPSFVNIKVSEIREAFHSGPAVMCVGEATMSDSPEHIARTCLAHPSCSRDILPGDVDLLRARDALVFVIGGEDMSMAFGGSISDEIVSQLPGMKDGQYIPAQYFIQSGQRDRIQVVAFFSGMTQVVRKPKQRAGTSVFERRYTPYR